jgi:hypothetical protein
MYVCLGWIRGIKVALRPREEGLKESARERESITTLGFRAWFVIIGNKIASRLLCKEQNVIYTYI